MIHAQHRSRFGYPTTRVPDPMRRRKKNVPYHNDLNRVKWVGGRLMQLHATKGWRRVP